MVISIKAEDGSYLGEARIDLDQLIDPNLVNLGQEHYLILYRSKLRQQKINALIS